MNTLMVLSLALLSATAESPRETVRRLAVLVGANRAPPGRQALRYAHRDAEQLRDALVRVGGVAPQDAVLLLDPSPTEVMQAVQRASATACADTRETVLYFYYSGHADDASLYPGGLPLEVTALREALQSEGATVRVGIFDACRGGAWTRSKGLSPAPPVEVQAPFTLAAEGSVLFASSSGLEEAHESERLEGSFFTHHLVAGLLGAADASGDGAVTATEAFQYAQAQTVRDSARASLEPQHPSFETNLHGRRDLVLAQLASAPSTLAVEQSKGPLQVVALPSGLVLLELPEGKRSARLAVAPGSYLVRRVDEGGVATAREVSVVNGETTRVAEGSLELVGRVDLGGKGEGSPPRAQQTTLPANTWGVGLDLGVSYDPIPALDFGTIHYGSGIAADLAGRIFVAYSPTDWLELAILNPGATVRLGRPNDRELAFFGGLAQWGYGSVSGWVIRPMAGALGRWWFTANTSLVAGAQYGRLLGLGAASHELEGKVFLTHTIRNLVSFNLGIDSFGVPGHSLGLALGSGRLGFRSLPLLQLHLTPTWTLDFDARVAMWLQPTVSTAQQYLVGATATW